MSNDSSTGGPLLPSSGPLEGQALNRFIQQWIVGISGLDGTMVRPRWQTEPSNIPDAGEAWASIGISVVSSDDFPFVDGVDLQRHEDLNLLCSFYDLGTNGLASYYAALVRDGTAIPQNREVLTNAGMGLASVGALQAVPSLLKLRWLYRVDLPLVVRRAIQRNYDVLWVLSADGRLRTDAGYDEPIIVTPPP